MKWYQEIIVLNKEIDGSMFYCFDEENYKKISDEREEQLKEIERLYKLCDRYRKQVHRFCGEKLTYKHEVKRLNNIINKLEKLFSKDERILSYIQELKGVDKE